jgi:hypothetical protein
MGVVGLFLVWFWVVLGGFVLLVVLLVVFLMAVANWVWVVQDVSFCYSVMVSRFVMLCILFLLLLVVG